jgi:cysteine-rich repeat protein
MRSTRALPISLSLWLILALTACGRTGLEDLPYERPPIDAEDADAALDVDPDEGPDEGPDLPPDLPEECGDGILHPDEACDDGEANSDEEADACRTDCSLPACGDGVEDSDEECDDGNDVDDDACTSLCTLRPDDPCSPCEGDDDCTRDVDFCVPLLDGAFCARACSDAEPCPDGFVCQEVGRELDQCVPRLEVCAGCLDEDGDRYGVGEECLGTDCNDADPDIHPFADEFCDGVDSDCNGVLDDSYALDAPTWYRDRDGDGFGDPNNPVVACTPPPGAVADDTDCDDTQRSINPGATEVCDDVDNNCNDENDEGCPPDLIVDGETIALSGEFLFDRVDVLNGGIVNITPFDGQPGRPDTGSEGTGCLEIDARLILVRGGSGFDASEAGGAGPGQGQDGGFGPGRLNVGPGGGGYGGEGGAGEGLEGGAVYGTASGTDFAQGSNGGDFLVDGRLSGACDDLFGLLSEAGVGGGCIRLSAPDIQVSGFILANGGPGQAAVDGSTPGIVDGGGGGSGGAIVLQGRRVTLEPTGSISARGGAGGNGATYAPPGGVGESGQCIGNGAGGGGGGRVKIFGDNVLIQGSISVPGGRGGTGPQSDSAGGDSGSTFVE